MISDMQGTAAAKRIKGAGLRVTKQRELVLGALLRANRPLHIGEILASVGEGSVDQVTAYRMLDTFQKADIVAKVDLQQGRAFYELRDPHDHHHLVCTSCKRVEDFVGCDFEALSAQALRQSRSFEKVTDHSFELFGTCKSCARA